MGELTIRRNREINAPQFQALNKTAKQAAAAPLQTTRRTANRAAVTVSETLRQLMSQVDKVGQYLREGKRTLQSGEAALAEVEDSLGKMEKLARQAAGDGSIDREALQSELEHLRSEIQRIAENGIKDGLFQEDGEGWEGLDALVDAVMKSLSDKQEGGSSLPGWLTSGMAGERPSQSEMQEALGISSGMNSWEMLAALGNVSLGEGSAADYVTAYYLGAMIAGGPSYGAIDPELAAQGLQLFLDAVAGGASPDEALSLLTGGAFTSMADFEAQFLGGTAPGLELFLMGVLFGQEGAVDGSLLDMLAAGGNLDMLMNLMAMLDGSGGLLSLLDGLGSSEGAAAQDAAGQEAASQMAAQELGTEKSGTVQVSGRDLSGAAFDGTTGELTLNTAQNMTLRGMGQKTPAVRLAGGDGTVTIQQVAVPRLTVEGGQARLILAGENVLSQIQLQEGAALTLEGGGIVHIGQLRGADGVLRLIGGVVVLDDVQALEARGVSVVVDGAVLLLAPDSLAVHNAQGERLTPFDILWKTMLPEWSALTGMALDGKEGRFGLPGQQFDPARMWLLKGNEDKGWPAHTIALRGRDRAGRSAAHYVYVRWDERQGGFQMVSMYPNPFTVTGGEQDVDWRYEEETQTLYILTGEVTAVSGGAGTDANMERFSGRLALADGIGKIRLALDGVECRVDTGGACALGRKNDVTLLLERGTENVFESGPGFAGIALGDNTALTIDHAKGDRSKPDGVLTARGGKGAAGIGRNSGAGQERTGLILIRDGVVSAVGAGGGAGIGGAAGAAVGDIRIQGGIVTALADSCAAAIGAGIQGACGDVTITGSARVAQARGGGPDGDIGGCLFGNCGKVQVSAGTDIGGAKLWTQKGLSIQMGEASLTMPKFHISAKALRLEGLDLSTREKARSAINVIVSDRKWMTRLQGAYGAMYGQLGQSFSSMHNVQQYTRVVRNNNEAKSLANDIREVLRLSPKAKFLKARGMEDVGALLRN